jgi:hypothetical protein
LSAIVGRNDAMVVFEYIGVDRIVTASGARSPDELAI